MSTTWNQPAQAWITEATAREGRHLVTRLHRGWGPGDDVNLERVAVVAS